MNKRITLGIVSTFGLCVLAAAAAEETLGDKFARFLKRVQENRRQAGSATIDMTAAKTDRSLQEGPGLIKPTELGVGHRFEPTTLTDLHGKPISMEAGKDHKALLLVFFSADCPLSAKFAPELARLEKECAVQQVRMILVDPIHEESPEAAQGFLTKNGLTCPAVLDKEGKITAALHAKTTTETFLIDAGHTIAYRGAINDQYGLGYQLEAPRHLYLRDALAAVVKGETPPVTATSAPGCALDERPAISDGKPAALTYHNQISRILNQNCVECHRTNGLAPFSLETYADVTEHAGMIKKQISRGAMPPWFAAPVESGHTSPWSNDRSLTEQDKTDLLTWLDSSRPQGNPVDAPLPRNFPKEWAIGEPDAVFQIPQPITVKAEGTMPYQNVTVPTTFTEDRWVNGYEVLPTDRSVVHHVIVRIKMPGAQGKKGGIEDRDGLWAAYVPGNSSRLLPEGFAKKLPAGAELHFQIHYTPKGKETRDQLKIGLKFTKQPPQYVVHVTSLAQPRINIPPNDANHVETATRPVPIDLMVTAFMPHMHVRGKSFKFDLTTRDGKSETLLDVPRYDFNWQLQYRLTKPILIPRGSVVKITAVYDNSSGNPANPDPNKNVRWGEQTVDEMMLGYVEFFLPNPELKMASN
jgi:hypothetical protein